MATTRGPLLFAHRPPKNAAKPTTKIAMVKVSVTCSIDQPNFAVSGLRKTLHAYTAPSAICMTTAANAIPQRFPDILVVLLRRCCYAALVRLSQMQNRAVVAGIPGRCDDPLCLPRNDSRKNQQ